jgi:hypothetical protein
VKDRAKNLLAVVISIVCSLVVGELLFRAISGVRVFDLTNYRNAQVVRHNLSSAAEYDPLLGWRMKPNFHMPGFNTIELGIRSNGRGDEHVKTGGILAVGASFTAGSEVEDEQAWPAQLEAIIGQPVANGAVGGFALDQIVLRAEELLPVLRPATLVVDLIPDNVESVSYSYLGRPKPYFTLEATGLRLQNNPVPRFQKADNSFDVLKDVLGYVLFFDRIMGTYYPDYWYSAGNTKVLGADNDDVAVSCTLLQRLKGEADKAGVRMLVTMQYGSGRLFELSEVPGFIQLLENCAQSAGIQMVDEFEALKAMARTDIEAARAAYVREPGGLLGHKSAKGNRTVAEMVADALKHPIDPSSALAKAPAVLVPMVNGDGKNLIKEPEALEKQIVSSHASFSEASSWFSSTKGYRIHASGSPGEHYVVLPLGSLDGPLTLSLEACAEGTSKLRLQLVAGQAEGVLGDFDLDSGSARTTRIGRVINIRSGASSAYSCWRRIWITANLPPESPPISLIIQLADSSGNYEFEPAHESALVRAVQVERGNTASPYQPTP